MDKETMKEMMSMIYEVLNDDQMLEAVSSFCWRLFEKLIQKGFTEEQAMGIVTSMAKAGQK